MTEAATSMKKAIAFMTEMDDVITQVATSIIQAAFLVTKAPVLITQAAGRIKLLRVRNTNVFI